jgi:long-chain fatty acid transport protein
MSQKILMKVIPALLLVVCSGTAGASGFAIQNQTGSGTGNAFAGAGATAEDAGTVYFNPAGMTYLPQGHTIAAVGTLLNRSIKFDNKGSTTNLPFPQSTLFPLPTGNGGDAGSLAVLPAGYWVYGISPNLSVGLGFSPTFGNTTEYKFDFVGRNAGYFFEMEQLNLNPSIAYKVNEMVSLGAGINFAYNKSHFKQGVVLSDPLGRTTGGRVRFAPNNYLDVEGDDWAVGYNLGAMFQVSPSTRIGLVYRSELKFDLEGEQEYAAPNALLVNQDIKATLKTRHISHWRFRRSSAISGNSSAM